MFLCLICENKCKFWRMPDYRRSEIPKGQRYDLEF